MDSDNVIMILFFMEREHQLRRLDVSDAQDILFNVGTLMQVVDFMIWTAI